VRGQTKLRAKPASGRDRGLHNTAAELPTNQAEQADRERSDDDTKYRLATVCVGLAAIALTGCASTAPKPQFAQKIVADARISAADTTAVTVDAPEDVKILPEEKVRLAHKIQDKINVRKSANVAVGAPKSYSVELHLTRYQKGSAVARFMLAGLGQIHIDGTVDVYQMPGHTRVGEFDLKKTFAWGGAYGASTSIEEIETTFADGVAATVTGQSDDKPKDKT
jgi:hypothetical protein